MIATLAALLLSQTAPTAPARHCTTPPDTTKDYVLMYPGYGTGVVGAVPQEIPNCTGAGNALQWTSATRTLGCANIAGGSGAPVDATYITQTADGTLTNEQAMGTLGTGLVLNTTTTGVQSIYAGSACGANQYATSTNASGALTCAQVATNQLSGTISDAQLASSYSGVGACGANQWASTLNDNGAPTCTQPGFANISGTVSDAQLANNYSGVGSCTNQFVRAANDNAAPTCASVANADISAVDASKITTGTIATARLGSGTANATTFLRGDQTWATPGGGSDPWTYLAVNGGANFSTGSATAVDVTGLSLTVTANTKYEFECTLLLRTATATVNPRLGFAWSTGLTDGVAVIQESQAATGTPLFASGNINAALLVAVGGLPNTTQSWPATIRASIAAGASPGGTTRVQLATETAATNVTVQATGSFCRYRTYTN